MGHMRVNRAATLIEILVVIAIIAIISAILFPVFKSARQAANAGVCASRFGNAAKAQTLYTGDYDDKFVPSSYQSVSKADPVLDRKWPQLLQSYTKGYASFVCPEDKAVRPSAEKVFNADLSLADPESRNYVLAQRTNIGYNGVFLSPLVARGINQLVPEPVPTSGLAEPSTTILFVDSVWEVRNSSPRGGGRYLVQPPGRNIQSGFGRVTAVTRELDTLQNALLVGWIPRNSLDEFSYGGTWPWHNGRMTVAYTDGHVKLLTPRDLSQGCAVQGTEGGTIRDLATYLWDLQ